MQVWPPDSHCLNSSGILSLEIKVKFRPELGKPWNPMKVKKVTFMRNSHIPGHMRCQWQKKRREGRGGKRQGRRKNQTPAKEFTIKVEKYKQNTCKQPANTTTPRVVEFSCLSKKGLQHICKY